MKQINYTGSSKLISRIVSLLNRKAPLPLDGNGDPDWGTNGQVLMTDGSGSTSWGAGGGGGDTVTWTQDQLSGTKIAEIDINGNSTDVYAPTPTAQVQSDWTEADNTQADYIKNKPNLATVATSGSYTDLSNKPTIPTVNDATLTITQNGSTLGTFSANASANVTIEVPGGGGSGGHTIEDTNGTDMPAEDNLQFVGVYTEDDSANDRTKVNIVRQMTKAQMESLSSAEKEGFIRTTDEDDDYIPIAAEDVKYRNTDVESKLDALTTDVSGKVSKSGDTMTGELKVNAPSKNPITLKGNSNSTYAVFQKSDGTEIGKIGVNSANDLLFWDESFTRTVMTSKDAIVIRATNQLTWAIDFTNGEYANKHGFIVNFWNSSNNYDHIGYVMGLAMGNGYPQILASKLNTPSSYTITTSGSTLSIQRTYSWATMSIEAILF